MSLTVRLPRVIADLSGKDRDIAVTGDTLRHALDDLFAKRPEIEPLLFDEVGAPRRHVRFLCNDEFIRYELDTPVEAGSTIYILHSISGG